jgi:hypothetical protein
LDADRGCVPAGNHVRGVSQRKWDLKRDVVNEEFGTLTWEADVGGLSYAPVKPGHPEPPEKLESHRVAGEFPARALQEVAAL